MPLNTRKAQNVVITPEKPATASEQEVLLSSATAAAALASAGSAPVAAVAPAELNTPIVLSTTIDKPNAIRPNVNFDRPTSHEQDKVVPELTIEKTEEEK